MFVGNLADTVDSTKLKQVFQQFTKVTECDVVKNYAFVHIEDDDVQSIINRLNGYTLEGKNIHIQLSTSKLRSQPGMSNQCFRCASTDHKTPNCPKDPNNQLVNSLKFAGSFLGNGPDAKRAQLADEEIPRPPEPELQQLYEEYHLSRQRYTYYRERLQKEIQAKRNGMGGSVYLTPLAPALGRTCAHRLTLVPRLLASFCTPLCVSLTLRMPTRLRRYLRYDLATSPSPSLPSAYVMYLQFDFM
ncbi:unnamed protein product [Heligmosomoides polygyrus]|uniref:RRM domain-containing protein n=1 Tax=Heligmosomoides polygyrus TaxID=6339 RepID=A0A3P8DRS6_HELPZ|nr:unnamed protein product [Heligmosomoides polygyrus]